MRNLAALMLLGVSGFALAQGAQQGGAQQSQPRQQSAQPGGAQTPSSQQGAQQTQRSQGQQQSQVPSFDTLDANRDGQLSRTEANEVDGLDFSEADINDNASLDRQEFMTAMSARSGSQPGAGSRPGAGSDTRSTSPQPQQTR